MFDEFTLFLVIVALYGFTKLSVIESLLISFKLAFELYAMAATLHVGMIITAILTIIMLMPFIAVRFLVV